MAVVKLILGSATGQGGAFSNTIVNSGNTLSNASLKTNDQNEFIGIRTLNKNGREMLSWGNNGILRFNSNGKLSNNGIDAGKLVSEAKPDMLVFGAVPSSKEYSVKLIFKGTKNVKGIVVYGDKVANQFATEAILNGVKTIYSGEYKMEINFNSNSDEQIVEFIKWNRANYNASFSQISVLMNNYEVSRGNGLKNVESLSQSTAQNNQIHYGVIANSGNVEVLDPNGEIKKLVLDGTLPISNMPVQIICNGKQIQSHISVDSDYDNNAKTLNIEFTNDLANWQDLQYRGYAYPKKSENAYNMLFDVFNSINYTQEQVDEMLSTEIIYGVDNQTGTIKQYLQEITIPYPYLPKASIRETIDKFCTLAQLQVFKTDDDKIKFISARPVATDKEKEEVIFIDKASIFGNFTRTILLKNKYNTVELTEKKVNDIIDYNSLVADFVHNDFSNIGENEKDNGSGTFKTYGSSYYSMENGGYQLNSRGTYSYIQNKYISGTHTFSASTSDGLKTILDLYSYENGGLKFSVTYRKKTKFVSSFKNVPIGTNSGDFSYSFSSIDWDDATEEIETFNIPIEIYSKLDNYSDVDTVVKLNNLSNSNITYNSNDKTFTINYDLLAFANTYSVSGTFSTVVPTSSSEVMLPLSGVATEYQPLKIDVSLYGDTRSITFEDIGIVEDTIENIKTIVNIQGSELLQQNSTFNNLKMSDIIKTNIKNDYVNGIANANISVACVDYYSNNMRKIKDWSKGETFEVSNLARVEGDDNLWRVTGRNFKKGGVPVVELELQAIK